MWFLTMKSQYECPKYDSTMDTSVRPALSSEYIKNRKQ
jgi:hypothetical protein